MSDTQTIISMSFPTVAILISILINNSRMTDLRHLIDKRFDDMNVRFADANRRFDDVNRRIDEMRVEMRELRVEMRDLIRLTSERHDANLHRVEEVLDARLKHLEE